MLTLGASSTSCHGSLFAVIELRAGTQWLYLEPLLLGSVTTDQGPQKALCLEHALIGCAGVVTYCNHPNSAISVLSFNILCALQHR